MQQVAQFFKAREVPMSESHTLEIYAFVEAADESKRRGGLPATLQSVIDKAIVEVASRRAD